MILTSALPVSASERFLRMGSKKQLVGDYPVHSSMINDIFMGAKKTSRAVSASTARSLHSLSTATKVDSSAASTYSTKLNVYKAPKLPTLNLSPREIELIRYTWNKMLMEEPMVKNQSSIPGAFPSDGEVAHQNSLQRKSISASSLALLLFCRQLYINLLSVKPELEALFPLIKHQAAAMGGVILLVILQLGNIEVLNDFLTGLAKRHSRVLVIERPQYELLGEAFVQTFVERFGIKFTHEFEDIWVRVYVYIASFMLIAGEDPTIDPTENTADFDYSNVSSDIETLHSDLIAPEVALDYQISVEQQAADALENAEVTSQMPGEKPLPPKPMDHEPVTTEKKKRRLKRDNCVVM